jgi:hypothetical protein
MQGKVNADLVHSRFYNKFYRVSQTGQNLFLIVLENGKSKIKVQESLRSREDLLSGSFTMPFGYVSMWQKEAVSFGLLV